MEYIKKEDLIIGEIYNSTTGSHIFKYIDKNGNNNLYCNNRSRFGKEKATVGIGLDNIVNATPEEKHWLEECIKLDKFITFDEAIKSFIPEYVECTQQLTGSAYKLGIIYEVKNNGFIKNDNCSYAYYNYNQDRFKPSTKEVYDAQFVVKEVKVTEPLPQFKVIETIETITKVENNEGNQFFIGDVVKSDLGMIQTIKSFKYNVRNTAILALTDNSPVMGININKIEHYIEPKIVEPEFILPEKWYIQRNPKNFEDLNEWENHKRGSQVAFHQDNNCSMFSDKDYTFTKPHNISGYTEITFNQFKKYVLKENIVDEPGMIFIPEETLLEKAKRLYPIGTKVSNYNLAKGCNFTITSDTFYEDYEKDILVKCPGIGNYTVYCNDKWAEIIN